MVPGADSGEIKRIEAALREWRQGDATLDDGTFVVHLADKRMPLTANAQEAASEAPNEYNVFDVFSPVKGLAVVSQSCDVVRACSKSECVEVSPLVLIDDRRQLEEIKKKRWTRYAYLPGLADRRLVVDLERTMTVEKTVVAGWKRIIGCRTDREQATFADALVRKRGRFAFPDAFNAGLRKLRDRLKKAEGKATAEGDLIAALDEIRVQASPYWAAEKVTVFFWFLLEPGRVSDFEAAHRIAQGWIGSVNLTGAFVMTEPAFEIVEPQDMTVDQYQASHALDYDDISP